MGGGDSYVWRRQRRAVAACVVLGAVLAWAQPTRSDTRVQVSRVAIDARTCIERVTRLIDELSPYAEQLAAQALRVRKPSAVSLVSIGEDNEPMLARYLTTTGEIDVFRGFCLLAAGRQRAVIAHELGHAVDLAQVGRRLVVGVQGDWMLRPGEIAATVHAIGIYRRAGLPESELAEQMPARHLEAARRRLEKD